MKKLNIAIVHTRLGCLDGVSVEADKWAKVYHRLNHKIFQIIGKQCKKKKIETLKIPEIYHFHPKINKLREEACSREIFEKKKKKLSKIYTTIQIY